MRILPVGSDIGEQDEHGTRGAIFSPRRTFRYVLYRGWENHDRTRERSAIAFVGLNPSTADCWNDDPTVRRCVGFAKAWGYCDFYMLNLFAYRATDPKAMAHIY